MNPIGTENCCSGSMAAAQWRDNTVWENQKTTNSYPFHVSSSAPPTFFFFFPLGLFSPLDWLQVARLNRITRTQRPFRYTFLWKPTKIRNKRHLKSRFPWIFFFRFLSFWLVVMCRLFRPGIWFPPRSIRFSCVRPLDTTGRPLFSPIFCFLCQSQRGDRILCVLSVRRL